MSPSWTTAAFERAEGGRRRVVTWASRRATPLERVLAWLILALAGGLLLALTLAVLLVSIPLAIAGAIAAGIARALRRMRGPNGLLDGRRNVRVITHEDR